MLEKDNIVAVTLVQKRTELARVRSSHIDQAHDCDRNIAKMQAAIAQEESKRDMELKAIGNLSAQIADLDGTYLRLVGASMPLLG